jgi:drug/metabolite transporter (DMT)-like permease
VTRVLELTFRSRCQHWEQRNNAVNVRSHTQPSYWGLSLAFAIVYVSWGTTYLAIKVGVRALPPGLFAGTRITIAALVLLGYLALRRKPLLLSGHDFLVASVAALFLFVAGNGLLTLAEKTVDSGVASVLGATTPLWMGLVESAWPSGERLTRRGWLGLLLGLLGVMVLLAPRLSNPAVLFADSGPLLVLCAALSWSVGTVILRYGRRGSAHLTSAAYQLLVGGSGLTLVGLVCGEARTVTPDSLTPAAVFAFFYLLVVGTLLGFLAYTWLLQHVSATLAGTYAYVNPAVAVLVGWSLGGRSTARGSGAVWS